MDTSGASVSDNPAVAASGNNALIVYEDTRGGGNVDIRATFYNGGTNTFTGVATLIADASGGLIRPDVAALTDGRYVVVWENTANDDIEGRFVDANGNPIGATFTIANNAGDNDDPRVAALPDGGFIVTWDTNGGVIAPENGGDYAVLARRFDRTGAPAGDLFLVNTGDPATSQFYPAVAVNPAHRPGLHCLGGHPFLQRRRTGQRPARRPRPRLHRHDGRGQRHARQRYDHHLQPRRDHQRARRQRHDQRQGRQRHRSTAAAPGSDLLSRRLRR